MVHNEGGHVSAMRDMCSFNLPAKLALRLAARAKLDSRREGRSVSKSEVMRRALGAYLMTQAEKGRS